MNFLNLSPQTDIMKQQISAYTHTSASLTVAESDSVEMKSRNLSHSQFIYKIYNLSPFFSAMKRAFSRFHEP